MLMTAAGTIRPATVLVLGAGVAGLQAIATARRLGAVVQGYDVRAAVKEQVESLGAHFLEFDLGGDLEGAGGYAKELTAEQQARQQELMAEAIGKADVVITTALVPGRRAPILVTEDAVRRMKPGSVVVDLAGEQGGNCELSRAGGDGRRATRVKIAAPLNVPSTLAEHASQLYARNIQALLELMTTDGQLTLDFEDEVIAGACITRGGEIVNEGAKAAARMTRSDVPMNSLVIDIAILVLAGFVGFAVISKVPNTLHTPLMSGTNAIHGIVVLGGLLLMHIASGWFEDVLLVIAVAFGTINVIGGFLVTDRMLGMFKKKPEPVPSRRSSRSDACSATSFIQSTSFIDACYIVAFSLFIYGMSGLTGPRTAVRGNKIAAVGHGDRGRRDAAVPGRVLTARATILLIVLGVVIGTAVGVPAARNVKMTAMPQMVALFNGVGGGAVAMIAWIEYRHALRRQLRAADHDPVAVRRDRRVDLVLGLEHRVRQAPGDPARPADQAAGLRAEHSQPRPAGRSRSRARSSSRRAPTRRLLFIVGILIVSRGPRRHGRAADRRRRHAGRDLAAERVHRACRPPRPVSRSTTRR